MIIYLEQQPNEEQYHHLHAIEELKFEYSFIKQYKKTNTNVQYEYLRFDQIFHTIPGEYLSHYY
jgi:hypothetical protein